jgi:tetratricopeptide (TPR) repeat protein
MSKKKRRFEQLEAAAANAPAKKPYVNPMQVKVEQQLEGYSKKLEGKGRTMLYALAALVLIGILAIVMTSWNRRSSEAAQGALARAIETSTADISETGTPAGSTSKTYKNENERADAAIAQFQEVVDKFGGAAGEKAKYFIAVNRLTIDRAAGIAELETLATANSETGKLSKFALAQTRFDDGRYDDAAKLYSELAALDDPVIAKDTINYELAKTYEKQDKRKEAADIYYNIAKAASELKDSEGKAVRMTETATRAKTRVQELDPERAKDIVEPAPESPFGGGMPIGM